VPQLGGAVSWQKNRHDVMGGSRRPDEPAPNRAIRKVTGPGSTQETSKLTIGAKKTITPRAGSYSIHRGGWGVIGSGDMSDKTKHLQEGGVGDPRGSASPHGPDNPQQGPSGRRDGIRLREATTSEAQKSSCPTTP